MNEVRPAAMREQRDIEWLVNWALEKQGLGRELLGEAGGGVGGLGVRVDTSLYSNDGKWTHDDAHVIADAIAAMSRLKASAAAAALVVHYGRLGLRPDWGKDGSGRWQLVRRNNGTGRAIKRYEDARQARGLLGFEWEWIGHEPNDLDRLMLEWLAWHAALCDLRKQVNSNLRHYVATGPSAPECPWDAAERVVHYPRGEGLANEENI